MFSELGPIVTLEVAIEAIERMQEEIDKLKAKFLNVDK